MNNPTYNTGKVQIGLLFVRPLPAIQGDAVRLQTALLSRQLPTLAERLAARIWGWL